VAHDDEDWDEEEEELELILFQGAMNGVEPDMKANARLTRVALIPAKDLVSDALARGAQEIIVEPKGARAGVRYIVDGVAYPSPALPGKQALAITQILKLLAGLDIHVRDEAQSGGINSEYEEKPWIVLVDTTPGRGGERLRLRLENMSKQIVKPDHANVSQEMRKRIRDLTTQQAGVFLIVGPPKSGATTTSYVALHTVDAYLYNLFSMADTGHRELINVTPYDALEGHDLEMGFDRLLRKEANLVFLDPIEDPETAQVVFDYQEKICIMAEFPAADPAAAIETLISWVGADAVAKGLKGILTQKMVRMLCEECKEAYRPNPKLLDRLGLPPEIKVLYREPIPDDEDPEAPTLEELCEPCGGLPYHGRMAMFELLEVTDGMKEVILEGAEPAEIKQQMREDDAITIQRDGLRLVVEGKTSLEELQRTLRPPQKRRRRRR